MRGYLESMGPLGCVWQGVLDGSTGTGSDRGGRHKGLSWGGSQSEMWGSQSEVTAGGTLRTRSSGPPEAPSYPADLIWLQTPSVRCT